jgi:hypothetical protein
MLKVFGRAAYTLESSPYTLFISLATAGQGEVFTSSKHHHSFVNDPTSTILARGDAITSDEIAEYVGRFYDRESGVSNANVTGMGENDGGVVFTAGIGSDEAVTYDPLLFPELIKDSIRKVKEARHGVSFTACTTTLGVPLELASTLESDLGLGACNIYLPRADPKAYDAFMETRNGKMGFQNLCSFLTVAAESGIPLSATVEEGDHYAKTSQLARALGASEVAAGAAFGTISQRAHAE